MIRLPWEEEKPQDEKRAAWNIILPGRDPFPMVGAPCTRAEALEYARNIWPGADIK